jgi:hypothetical protein
MVWDSDPRGSPVAIGTSAPLHVAQTLDDLSVLDAQDVDASNPILFALAPAKLPADDPAVAHRGDFLSPEDKVGGRRHALPESEASFTPFVARSIRGRRRILEDTALADEIIEVFGAMLLKCVVEAFHDVAGSFAVTGHSLTSLNDGAADDPDRVADDLSSSAADYSGKGAD